MPNSQQVLLPRITAEINERMEELKPLVAEYSRLDQAAKVLNGTPPDQPARKRPGRPRKSVSV
jgi:hypothetical protein